ncbi:MAG: hypothetical protein NZQ09_06175 [Chloroflexus sp.]|nr:hypothetical protein [Chloroflexus sp.]
MAIQEWFRFTLTRRPLRATMATNIEKRRRGRVTLLRPQGGRVATESAPGDGLGENPL